MGSMRTFYSNTWPSARPPLILTEFVTRYRNIYQQGVELFTEFNPCAVQNGTCFQGRLLKSSHHFCCDNCDYITDTGCTAEALYCKLWICGALRAQAKLHPKFRDQLNSLVKQSGKLCRSQGGRLDLSDYIKRFYGIEEYDKWKITEASSAAASSMSGR